jgi:hypothetical protein
LSRADFGDILISDIRFLPVRSAQILLPSPACSLREIVALDHATGWRINIDSFKRHPIQSLNRNITVLALYNFELSDQF